jgi:hypothetical protein
LGIFWVLAQGLSHRGREANFKITNEGIAKELFDPKTIQKTGTFRRFIGLFGRKKVFLEGGFRRIVRILWMVLG